MENKKENIEKFESYLKNRSFSDIDIIDLIRFVANQYGAKFEKNKAYDKLLQIINPKNNIVFVLVDGMGAYKVSELSENHIFKEKLKYAISTVNPTSTACILSSICFATYPSEHGILGWWDRNYEYGIDYYPLLFKERKTGIDLEEKGINIEDIFKFDNVFDMFNSEVNIYMDRKIISSKYSKMFAGKKANRYGGYSVKDILRKVNKNLKDKSRTFSYVYIDGLDNVSHLYGVDSKEVENVIFDIEDGIKKIILDNKDVTVIVTADHGQVEMNKMLYLNEKFDYTKFFYAMPSIDTRMISFFVKPEFCDAFKEKFLTEFGDDALLFTRDEAEYYNLFGGYKFSEDTHNSVGQFVAVIVNNKFMVCDKISYDDYVTLKGNHSGLTPEETTIPLIVIESER